MDNFMELYENFIEKKKDYANNIRNFVEYCMKESKYDIASKEINRWIMAVDTQLILDSLKYHILETGKYKSKSSAFRYMSAVGQMFEYIKYNSQLKVTNLFEEMQMDRTGNSYYIRTITNYINKCDALKGIVEAMPINSADVVKLIEWSDVQLSDSLLWNEELGYKKALVAIAIKMMLIYGLTYRELRNLKWEKYNEKKGMMEFNGFGLRLPMNLTWQMNNWKESCEKNNRLYDYIFTDYYGSQWGDTTTSSFIPACIINITGNNSLTSIIKYGIFQMIQAGISETVIRKISGASDTLLMSCVENANESMVQEVNKKIVNIDMYDRF